MHALDCVLEYIGGADDIYNLYFITTIIYDISSGLSTSNKIFYGKADLSLTPSSPAV